MSLGVRAEPSGLIEWHAENIQYLRGWNYDVGEKSRTIITFEHANSWAYGDFFMFVDATRFDGGGSHVYAELSPRFSLRKLTGRDFSSGIVRDILISATLEEGEKSTRAYLYGGAVDLSLPGFTFFNTNLYVRDDPALDDETWQLTLAWKRPIDLQDFHFLFEGFADFSGREDSKAANELIVPRLLLDVGALLGYDKRTVYTGIEYSYWHNKFGIEGTTESVAQFQIKWVL